MLNDKQKEAVHTTEGRLLILAGAGSGKTNVIVHRIAHLISHKKVSPRQILGLTFTNKAALEMRERIAPLVGSKQAKEISLSTFHSFCMKLLRKEIHHLGYTKNFSLYDERDIDRIITSLTRDMLGVKGDLPSLAPTKAALMEALNDGSSENKTWHDAFSKELFGKFQSTLRAQNALSFDHLIQLTVQLFEKHPDVLLKYQEEFRYLLIDEYQDTNSLQLRLAELIAGKYNNLCVVGDDDQSIYGWRGAVASNILNFKADTTIKLEQNYRSTTPILKAANHVIAHNKERLGKNLWSTQDEGEPIEVFTAPTDVEEAAAVIQRIISYRTEKKLKWKDIAILYRSNALSRQFEMALMQASWCENGSWLRGIPYEIFGGLEFSERAEIKDLFAYLRVIANPKDEEALLRIINVPRRGVSDTFLDNLTQENRLEKISLWELIEKIGKKEKDYPSHPKGMQGITSFYELMETAKEKFKTLKLSEALLWFLEKIDYKKAIVEEVKSEKMRAFKWENVQECVSALAHYENEAKENATLQDFIAESTLAKTTFTSHQQKSDDKVQVMTFHSSKGLEFPACFLVALEDHILPHEKSVLTVGIEEERRLFYVGITRARKYLTLSMARSRMKMGKPEPSTPSRFLFEIPKELFKVTPHK